MVKKIVAIIPSYKNEKWCIQNMQSILAQNYPNFRVIYTDDHSPDGTYDLVYKFIANYNLLDKVTLIRNDTRLGALHNLYNMIHSCEDDEIIVTLDGDDWFAHPDVLQKINDVYSNENVWTTYGSYQDVPSRVRGCCRPYEAPVINANAFRRMSWRASHLRTYYAWLFKKIKQEDFYDKQGKWLDMAWDLSIMLPILEMSGERHRYIHDILYCYNNENPISDHKVDQHRQRALAMFIRSKPKYQRLL